MFRRQIFISFRKLRESTRIIPTKLGWHNLMHGCFGYFREIFNYYKKMCKLFPHVGIIFYRCLQQFFRTYNKNPCFFLSYNATKELKVSTTFLLDVKPNSNSCNNRSGMLTRPRVTRPRPRCQGHSKIKAIRKWQQ